MTLAAASNASCGGMQALIIDGTDTEEDAEVAASSQQTSAEEEVSPERKAVLDRLEGEENPLAAGLKVIAVNVLNVTPYCTQPN